MRRILSGDENSTGEALDALAPTSSAAAAATERLLTGRRAEEFVLENSAQVLGYPRSALVDMRDALGGFDLLVDIKPAIVVEVKGLRGRRGELLFTDREWSEAGQRRDRYWLAVVANLDRTPSPEVIVDPARQDRLRPRCVFERSVRPSWRCGYVAST